MHSEYFFLLFTRSNKSIKSSCDRKLEIVQLLLCSETHLFKVSSEGRGINLYQTCDARKPGRSVACIVVRSCYTDGLLLAEVT